MECVVVVGGVVVVAVVVEFAEFGPFWPVSSHFAISATRIFSVTSLGSSTAVSGPWQMKPLFDLKNTQFFIDCRKIHYRLFEKI